VFYKRPGNPSIPETLFHNQLSSLLHVITQQRIMSFLSKEIRITFAIKALDNDASLMKNRVVKIYDISVSTLHDKRKKIASRRD
jgi:hypothetical protein